MSRVILDKIERFERLYRKNGSVGNAWGLALRYYMGYKVMGDKDLLKKAYHLAANTHAINFHFTPAYFLKILIDIEMGGLSKAQVALERLKGYKNGLKNEPALFAYNECLWGLLELEKRRLRSSRRHFVTLDSYNNNADDKNLGVLLGGFALALGAYPEALGYFQYAYDQGSRSWLLYLFLYDFFASGEIMADAAGLLEPFLTWALSQGIDAGHIAENWKDFISAIIPRNMALGMALYRSGAADWTLRRICETLIKERERSAEAFWYYREAESRQLYINGLSEALISAAFENGSERVSRYSTEKYLASGAGDESAKPFVYHLMLSSGFDANPSAPDSDVVRYRRDIINLGLYYLDNNVTGGLYLNSVYRFLIYDFIHETKNDDIRYASALEKASKFIWDAMFTYDLTVSDPGAGFAWVFENEKRQSKIYEIKDGRAEITASSGDFSCLLFDRSMRNILESGYESVCRLNPAPGVDETICLWFYERGFRSPELLVAITGYFSRSDNLPANFAKSGVQALEEASASKELSDSVKTRANAVLGRFYAQKNDYVKAAAKYSETDERELDDGAFENMLLALTDAKDFGRAARLVNDMPSTRRVSDKALFYCVNRIAAVGGFDAMIADAAYSLTFKGRYDKRLVSIALSNRKASLSEWQEFSRALSAIGAADPELNKTILEQSVMTRRFDAGTQKAFAALYNACGSGDTACREAISRFAWYSAYEMIINGRKPEYEAVEIFEKMALGGGSAELARFLAHGLCHVYKNYNITTFRSDEIIGKTAAWCEEEGFFFPVLKEIKDKIPGSAYIEKNQPFIYRGGKGKKVWLYYKAKDGKNEYTRKAMRYIRFGLYAACVPVFFGEELMYYYSEEISTGSIVTKEASVRNDGLYLVENPSDLYYIINNALIYESMFKYEAVESIVTDILKETPRIKGWII